MVLISILGKLKGLYINFSSKFLGHFENFEVRYHVDPGYPGGGRGGGATGGPHAPQVRSRREKFDREVTDRMTRRTRGGGGGGGGGHAHGHHHHHQGPPPDQRWVWREASGPGGGGGGGANPPQTKR